MRFRYIQTANDFEELSFAGRFSCLDNQYKSAEKVKCYLN